MRGLAMLVTATIALCMLAAQAARTEDLVVTLSDRTVDITSNFTGSSITVFGAIRRDAATVARASDYDVVVTVIGPIANTVTRKKERVAGIWINRSFEVFEGVPSAYSVLSNRPIEDIAHPRVLSRLGVGLRSTLVNITADDALESADESNAPGVLGGPQIEPMPELSEFEVAFLRIQAESGAYLEDPQAVSVIDNEIFRARAPFPADVPLGNFTVRVLLFSGGVLLAQEDVGILVRKTGFEQFLFAASQSNPLSYGLGAVLLALLTGWLGGVVFRRS
ncbi:MAG: TIGR02186 family protein [Pseudomonadota bacterium]